MKCEVIGGEDKAHLLIVKDITLHIELTEEERVALFAYAEDSLDSNVLKYSVAAIIAKAICSQL